MTQPPDKPQPVIHVPAGYANAELNGERVIVLSTTEIGITNTLIISGPLAGRYWQFCTGHLQGVA